MRYIKLSNSDQFAIVDDPFYEFLIRFTWSLCGEGYPQARVAGITLRLHQLIANTAKQTDHINENKLDNQLINLRVATDSQNSAHRKKFTNRKYSSKYKGVYYVEKSDSYRAAIRADGELIRLGSFLLEEQAAKAYDRAARKYFKEFASLNFPANAIN